MQKARPGIPISIPGEALGCLASLDAHHFDFVLMLNAPSHSMRERLQLSGLQDPSVDSFPNDVRPRSRCGGDNRQPTGHCFEEDQSEALEETGEYQNVALGHQLRELTLRDR